MAGTQRCVGDARSGVPPVCVDTQYSEDDVSKEREGHEDGSRAGGAGYSQDPVAGNRSESEAGAAVKICGVFSPCTWKACVNSRYL